jgi:hypothetical protein
MSLPPQMEARLFLFFEEACLLSGIHCQEDFLNALNGSGKKWW